MAYNNIGNYISQSSKKNILLWTFFSFLLLGLLFYIKFESSRITFIEKQINMLSEINNQALSVLYYHEQGSTNTISFERSLFNLWLIDQQQKLEVIVPAVSPELNLLKNRAMIFFGTNQLSKDALVNRYQELNEQIEVLKSLSNHYIINSPIQYIYQLMLPTIFGIFLIVAFFSLHTMRHLKKELVSKNNIVLEDMWNEIQDFNFEYESSNTNSENSDSEINIDTSHFKYKMQELLKYIHSLSQTNDLIKSSLVEYSKELTSTQNIPIKTSSNPQNLEKITYIQKLLSHLFTRAQRASSLAKASSDNGFQAGILALNISIEASRSGETGKKFLPVSDRVKDFAEKSSHIGSSLLEELKDVDLAIRKAYAIGKELIEQKKNSFDSTIENTSQIITNTNTLQKLIQDFDQITQVCDRIQKNSTDIDQEISQLLSQDFSNGSYTSLRNIEFIKASLVRSFERLYRFNYGIDPPSTEQQ